VNAIFGSSKMKLPAFRIPTGVVDGILCRGALAYQFFNPDSHSPP
jgi:hypothetical protein